MILAIYDLSGIQKYIFSTSKLKEQVGGSRILHNIMYRELPEVLGEEQEAWKKRTCEELTLEDKGSAIVYIGGGNAVVLYKNQEEASRATRALQKRALQLTSGEITICYSYMPIEKTEGMPIDGKTEGEGGYRELYARLMKQLIAFKQESSPIRPASGFGFNVQDSLTFDSITYLGKRDNTIIKDSAYRHQRIAAFEDYSAELQKQAIEANAQLSHVLKSRFAKKFEDFRKADKKSYVAVVHIDGDSVGNQIDQATSQFNSNLKKAMLEMRDLSKEIDELYRKTFEDTIVEYYGESVEKTESTASLPIRPIIADGDDITFMIEASHAIPFVSKFVELLNQKIGDRDSFPELTKYKFNVSISAGIVYVHDKYPFDQAYELSEELCSQAKKVKRANNLIGHLSSFDFHVVRGSGKYTVKEFRKRFYEGSGYRLHKRPYLFDVTAAEAVLKDEARTLYGFRFYSGFQALLHKMNEFWNDENTDGIARNKLKALRDSYSEGTDAAQSLLDFVRTRYQGDSLGVSQAFEDPEIPESGEAAESTEFYESRSTRYATLFDAIDIIDMGGAN